MESIALRTSILSSAARRFNRQSSRVDTEPLLEPLVSDLEMKMAIATDHDRKDRKDRKCANEPTPNETSVIAKPK